MMSDNRPYSFNDAKALTIAARLCRLYEEQITAFEELDPDLGTDFRDDWQQAIDTAMNIPTDETTVDNQQISAALLAESLDQCAATVRDLRYYANRAFKGKDEFNVFGFSRLSRMRHAPANYAVAVRTMHLLAMDHTAELTAKGMTPAQIQALLDTAIALTDAEVQHELKKRHRVRTTLLRKRAFEHVWSFVQRIQLAADVLYAEDEVVRGVLAVGE
jgi:hypothetical protein